MNQQQSQQQRLAETTRTSRAGTNASTGDLHGSTQWADEDGITYPGMTQLKEGLYC